MGATQVTTQAIVSARTTLDPNQATENFALFLKDGASLINVISDLSTKVAALTARVDDLEEDV